MPFDGSVRDCTIDLNSPHRNPPYDNFRYPPSSSINRKLTSTKYIDAALVI